jgi:hypothetical protein
MDSSTFNLKNKTVSGPLCVVSSPDLTEEEIAEKLVGYTELPLANIESIKASTQVRYIRKDVGFRSGGFVNMNPICSKNDDKKYIQIRTSIYKRKGDFVWMVCYDDIEKIYIKTSITEELFRARIDELEESNIILHKKFKELVLGINAQNTMFANKINKLNKTIKVLTDMSDHSSNQTLLNIELPR